MKKYDPRCREDRISRSIWDNNVTQRDRVAEKQRIISAMIKKFPEYSMEEVLRMLRSI